MNRRAEFNQFVTKENLHKFWWREFQLCGDRHLAWDLVQEACVKLWLSDGPMAMPYMYCILRTVFLDHVRKRKRRPEKLVAEIADDDRFYGGADIEIDDEVRDAFRKLPERSQIALNLKYHEGWKTAQIAEALELRPNQVSRLMYSALEKIRKELASKPAQLRKSEE